MHDPERRGERSEGERSEGERSEGGVRMGREVLLDDRGTITSFSTLTSHLSIAIYSQQTIAMIDIFFRYHMVRNKIEVQLRPSFHCTHKALSSLSPPRGVCLLNSLCKLSTPRRRIRSCRGAALGMNGVS